MSRLDWEKARERERAQEAKAESAPGPDAARRRSLRQTAMAEFVTKHNLRCFKCGADRAEWAKTGISKSRPWAICVECASAPRDTNPIPIALAAATVTLLSNARRRSR